MRIPMVIGLIFVLGACSPPENAVDIRFSEYTDGSWMATEWAANPMQDWEIRDGRLLSQGNSQAHSMRTMSLLTRTLNADPGSLHMSVLTGVLPPSQAIPDSAWVGFLVGGLIVAVDGEGRIFVRGIVGTDNAAQDNAGPDNAAQVHADLTPAAPGNEFEPRESRGKVTNLSGFGLRLMATAHEGTYSAVVETFDPESEEVISYAVYTGLAPHYFIGSLALASNSNQASNGKPASNFSPASSSNPSEQEGGHWFDQWEIEGSKVEMRTIEPSSSTKNE